MTSPQTKTNLVSWQWALIGSGSTLILVLAGFGLWNLVTSKSPTNSSVSQNSGQPALNSANIVASNDTIKRLLGQWLQKDSTRLIFTAEGKLFVIPSNSNQAIEGRYQVNDQTKPNQLTISTPANQTSQTVIFEFTSDNQLRIDDSRYRISPQFSPNTKSFQKVSDIASLPLGITLVDEQVQVRFINKAKQSEAINYVGTMNRAQQAFFLENNQFTSDWDKLRIGIKSSTENYAYSIVAIDDKRIVQNVGLAKTEGLKSYTGIVFVKKNASTGETNTLAKLCESIQPTREMPPQPQLSGDDMQCPAGYVDLNRN
ncbi:MAG: type IV pilin-like G/H family protein [Nostoc sp.]|uniref:type IV pilin-like G/H family protein n=1 Tax=Nostoc sp. TaxID=1180 RepID=UPI002FF02366